MPAVSKKQQRFICLNCGNPCSRPNSLCLACYRTRPKQTRADKLAYMKMWHQRVKDAVFNAYGGYRCVCCGETKPIFLVIDHINGGGNKERRRIGTSGGAGQYWAIRKLGFLAGYQVLCHNCNYAKTRGGCPHAS